MLRHRFFTLIASSAAASSYSLLGISAKNRGISGATAAVPVPAPNHFTAALGPDWHEWTDEQIRRTAS